MRRWFAALLAIAACEVGPSPEVHRTRDAVVVRQTGGAGALLGESLAGCTTFTLVGALGTNQVFKNTVPLTLPPLLGYGNAVACTLAQDTAVSAADSHAIVTSLGVLDAGQFVAPGLSLSMGRAASLVWVAAGAPKESCAVGPFCAGGVAVWQLELDGGVNIAVSYLGGAGQGLGTAVSAGRFTAGDMQVAVAAPGASSPRLITLRGNGLTSMDAIVPSVPGVHSVAFATISSRVELLVAVPASSRAFGLIPSSTQHVPSSTSVQCPPDSGVGVKMIAFDWDGDGSDDVFLSNPAANVVGVGLSSRGYACELLPVPPLYTGVGARFGQSMAASDVVLPKLLVGVPGATSDAGLNAGVVLSFDVCEVPGFRCDGGASLDGGAQLDAGTQTDAGTATDAGMQTDAGTQTDAGMQTDAGTQTEAGTTTDAGTQTDAGLQTDAGMQTDAGTQTDAGP
ncbi:MAG: hypothetical protein JNM69_18330, partial [Archangium sp.]|nr:hypothetical protein [Archangium sp.]